MKVLGVIPARGGSKGVKRKNVRMVGGFPLIYWSIEAAKGSKEIANWYVNTDDAEISEVAMSFDAEVLERPASLAQDKTPMIPVLQYVCQKAEEIHGIFDTIVLLQPTAPMRTAQDVDSAIQLFHQRNGKESLVSVYQVDDCHPSRMYRLRGEANTLEKIYEEPKGSLRQDLEPIFHRNGALYICTRDLLMNKDALTCSNPMPYIMPKSRSANIDDEQDLKIADYLISNHQLESESETSGSS